MFSVNDSTSLESGYVVFVLHDKKPRTLSTYICEAYPAQAWPKFTEQAASYILICMIKNKPVTSTSINYIHV